MFLTRNHERCETVQEALEKGINYLLSGKFNQHLVDAFTGDFGPEPFVTFQITINRDPRTPGTFAYRAAAKISHEVGTPVKLFGLKP